MPIVDTKAKYIPNGNQIEENIISPFHEHQCIIHPYDICYFTLHYPVKYIRCIAHPYTSLEVQNPPYKEEGHHIVLKLK